MDAVNSAEQIRRNALKSIAIVVAFPFVLPALLFIVVTLIASITGRPDAVAIGGRTFVVALVVMIAITVVWLPIGYLLNQWIVDQSTGARLVTREQLPRVWSIVDSLSTRCGIRPPALRLIDTEALNAYASGLTEGSYCVTVTTGLLDALEDDELEGVLAHELTHIVHQDVRLMVVAGVLVGTIPMVHDLGMKVFWGLLMGILNIYRSVLTLLPMPGAKLMVTVTYTGVYWLGKLVAYGIGLVATLCSLMLQFALSRRREFMADAGAAAMTGKPEALIAALRKISGNATLDTALAAVRAMCIENGEAWFGLFATHPPIEERIAALAQLPMTPAIRNVEVDEPRPAVARTRAELPEPASPALDPAGVARYKALLARAAPERMDIIAREHLYRRARETVKNAAAQQTGITTREIAQASAYLEAAIDEIEAALGR